MRILLIMNEPNILMKVDDCLVKTNGSDIGIRTFEIYYLCSG